jgi:hypothetical protein
MRGVSNKTVLTVKQIVCIADAKCSRTNDAVKMQA